MACVEWCVGIAPVGSRTSSKQETSSAFMKVRVGTPSLLCPLEVDFGERDSTKPSRSRTQ